MDLKTKGIFAQFIRKVCHDDDMAPGKHQILSRHSDSDSDSEVAQSCPALCDPMTVANQAPPSMAFSRQEYWSGFPFPSPGDLPDPGIEPGSPAL